MVNGHKTGDEMDKNSQATQILRSAKQRIDKEQDSMLLTGRSLSSEDRQRMQTLDALESDIEKALSNLQGPQTFSSPYSTNKQAQSPLPIDGRYTVGNDTYTVELHVDVRGSGIISGDIYSAYSDYRGDFSQYVASFRSEIATKITPQTNPLPIFAYDKEGRKAKGVLLFNTIAGKEISLQIQLDDKVRGLPVSRIITFSGRQVAQTMREICLELEGEAGAEALPEVQFAGQRTTVKTSLEDAGFEVFRVGRYNQIPPPPIGRWDSSQAHGLMTQFAKEPFERKAWNFVTLMLQKHDKKGLIAETYHTLEPRLDQQPKSGVATYQEALREKSNWQQKLIQTTVHAIGHALNLENRFNHQVGQQNSPSFMNFDWKYLGGDNAERYWRDFSYSFAADELAFLRHAPHSQLHPVTASPNLSRYWELAENEEAGISPQLPTKHYTLKLLPPSEGAIFRQGQPVLLGVELTNNSGRAENIPQFWLDAKAGLLEITIERTGINWSQKDSARAFRPLVKRSYDADLAESKLLPHEGKISENVNLTYGLDGFTFAQTGSYTVTASLYLHQGRRPCVVHSEPLNISIACPKNEEEERDAHDLLTPEVGLAFALGGSDMLPEANRIFDAIIERRQRRGSSVKNPIVANILRCKAINAIRDFVSYTDGTFKTRPANVEQGLMNIRWLNEIGPRIFDPVTSEQMRTLVEKGKERMRVKVK